MKFTSTLLLFVTAVTAQPTHWRFKLLATTYRFQTPALSGYVDLDASGIAGFNRSSNPSSTGFYMDAATPGLPSGPLHKEDTNTPGYLLPTSTSGLYDFVFSAVPPVVGVLSTDFAVTELACGGNCGGLQLVYATGTWVAYEEVGKGWVIRYWNGEGQPPVGGYGVWLVREGV
ncbi:hypothetical protein K440DRAFT_643065 [Wilcoxina mikolae CBS 423.85]|nr:hypothetical protein K440DRAFT_643065 [Wilcoxina mikolae CBS 423.85]